MASNQVLGNYKRSEKVKKILFVLAVTAVLAGCKTKEPLYYHGQYNAVVYNYFKSDDMTVSEQVEVLKELINTAKAKNKNIAPGVHAHLGMLYFELGNANLGLEHFNIETELFPESKQYIDFLVNSAKGKS